MVRIRLLGPIDAVVDGETVELGGRRQRRLLLRLVLADGRVVTEAELIDAIWDETETLPSNPSNTVQQYVSRLRGVLGTEVIVTTSSGYALDRSATTDIDDFETSYETARVLIGQGDLLGGHEHINRATKLWRGPVFGDLCDIPVARFEATRLEELRVSALERSVQSQLDAGDVAGATAAAEALAAEHPLREAPVRTLAIARRRSGQPAGAIRAISEFRQRLADETGLDPTPELVQLERDLLTNDAPPTPEAPRQLRGYELNELIAQGAFGSVYRATQPSVGREVAIKVVRPELANNPQFIRRFEVEAQMVARLEHPHIVPLHDYWREPGGAYLVMRYLRGGSAEQRLVADGPMSLSALIKLVDEIGGALAMAHDAGIVHRDVKPANIIFDENDNAYLADFGIAIADGHAAELDLRSAGSPLYVSPEQIRHGEAIFASDIYAFGVVIYELLTGSTPFPNVSTIAELLDRKLSVRLPLASSARADVPGTIDAVIQHATEPLASDRFASMGELILAFRSAAVGYLAGAATTGSTSSISSASPGDQSGARYGDERPRAQAARTLVTLEWQGTNPYKGLAAFQEADSADFFGRDELIERLHDHIGRSPFLAVVGPSGSGKSSAVRAGLVPRLRAAGLFVAQMVPGEHPMHELETALLRVAVDPLPTLLEQLNADAHGLARAAKRCLPESGGELVLVIDQFEELYTMTGEQERNEFLEALAAAVVDPHGRLRIVVTLRADFYDRPLASAQVGNLFDQDAIAVTPLSAEELERAIVGPAERVGASVEPALVSAIIHDVSSAPGALPLVQFALTETFERRSGSLMTLESYRSLGGVMGALARRADEVHDAATDIGQADLRRLFIRLITPGEGTEDTRRRIKLSDLPAIDPGIVTACGEARLLSFDHDQATREPTVEVAHEALIREWSRLRSWLDDDRDGLRMLRHLDSASQEWEAAGRPTAELYRGGRLEAIEEWAPEHADDLSTREQEFLDASLAQRTAAEASEQKTQRRLHRLLAGVAIVAAMALIASGIAFQQRSQASANADEATSQAELAAANEELAEERAGEAEEATAAAEKSAFDAETGRLVASAESLVSSNPRAAMLVAVAAHQRVESPETLGALQSVLSRTGPLLGHLQWGTDYIDIEWLSEDRIVGISNDSMDLIDPSSGEIISSVPLTPNSQPLSALSRTYTVDAARERLVVATDAPSIRVFDLLEGRLIESLEISMDAPLYSVNMTDSGRFVVADTENRLIAFDATGRELFSRDVDDHASWLDQVLPLIGEPGAPFYATLPVFSKALANDDRIIMVASSLIYQFDWNGNEVGSPSVISLEALTVEPGSVGHLLEIDDNTVELVANQSRARVDVSNGWPAAFVMEVTDGNEGGGAPDSKDAVLVGDQVFHILSDGNVAVFTAETGRRTAVIDVDLGAASAMALAPSQDRVALAHDQGISIVSITGSLPLAQALPRQARSNTLSITSDGSLVVLGPPAFVGPLGLWRRDQNGYRTVDLDESRDISFAFAPPSRNILDIWTLEFDQTTAEPKAVSTVYDANDFEVLFVNPNPAPGTTGGDSVERKIRLIGSPFPSQVLVLDWEQELLAELPPPGGNESVFLSSTTFDSAASRVLVANRIGQAALWDAFTWEQIDNSTVERDDIAVGNWSQDGSLVATSSSLGVVSIRDGQTFEVIRTMTGATGAGNSWGAGSLFFSADNRLLLTNHDGPGQLWDVGTGQQIGGEFPTMQGVNSGANVGDDLHLVTATPDTALVWNLNIDEWAGIACRTAGSELSQSEWEQWGPRDEERRSLCGGSI